jgi:hypothetical protein
VLAVIVGGALAVAGNRTADTAPSVSSEQVDGDGSDVSGNDSETDEPDAPDEGQESEIGPADEDD